MPASFAITTPKQTLLDHNTFSRSRIAANPLTAALVGDFDVLHALWCAVNQQEIDLECEVQNATARIVDADDHLDDFVTKHASAVLVVTKNDRDQPLFKLFYGNQSPSVFSKPILSKQLEKMRPWVATLQSSPYPALVPLAAELVPLLASADAAVAALTKAKNDLAIFTSVGGRKDLVDKFNSVRNTTHGKIVELVSQNPALMLAPTFADRFFKPLRVRPETQSLKDLEAELKQLQDRATEVQKAIDALKADAQSAATKESQLADYEKQLEAAKQGQDASAAKVAEIEALIAEAKK